MSESDGNLSAPAAQFVAKLAIKLPDFRTDDPDLWFMHAEFAFRNSQVTQSKTKIDHVMQKLPQNIMILVRGLIMKSAASSSTPYEDLKAKLVSFYTLLHWQIINKLIHHPALGDWRPTALMDAMLALLPDDEVPGSLFLGLFLERLPVEMRDLLVSNEFKNPSEMALHADKLWDAHRTQTSDPLLAATATSPSRARTCDRGSTSPSRRTQNLGPATPGECYFLKRFGSAANNCRPPCNFLGNARADGRRRN